MGRGGEVSTCAAYMMIPTDSWSASVGMDCLGMGGEGKKRGWVPLVYVWGGVECRRVIVYVVIGVFFFFIPDVYHEFVAFFFAGGGG